MSNPYKKIYPFIFFTFNFLFSVSAPPFPFEVEQPDGSKIPVQMYGDEKYNYIETQDGYVTAGAMSDEEWQGMCSALQKPKWEDDERFKDTAARFINAKERIAETALVIKDFPSEYWLKRFDHYGVPSAPVLTRSDMIENVQVKHNEIISEYQHPGIGKVRQVRQAARFEFSSGNPTPFAPRLGEHNREILESLGYSNEEINKLYDAKVVVDFSLDNTC